MVWVARLLIVLFGVLFIATGINAMLDPSAIMNEFHLFSPDATGSSAVRADMGAFFTCSAAMALWALVPGQRHWLLVPIALFATAFTGRLFGVFLSASNADIISAMLIEAASVAILVFSFVMLGKKKPDIAASAPLENRTYTGTIDSKDLNSIP